jgi:hypothetical protein
MGEGPGCYCSVGNHSLIVFFGSGGASSPPRQRLRTQQEADAGNEAVRGRQDPPRSTYARVMAANVPSLLEPKDAGIVECAFEKAVL